MHCGSVAGPARKNELSLDEGFKICKELIKLKCKYLTFIGGEIFLYDKWEEIAKYLSENNIVVNIISNGFRLGKKEIEKIKYAKLNNVGLSIDGTEDVHNKIRRNKKSFAGIKKALGLLNQSCIPAAAITTVMKSNYGNLEELYNFLVLNKVRQWQIQIANPMGNMLGKESNLINAKKIPSLINFIIDKNKDRRMIIAAADDIGYYYKDTEPYIRGALSPLCYWEGCSAGLSSVFIDSEGNVKGCGSMYDKKFIEGNLREKSLEEIWNEKNNFRYNRKFNGKLLEGNCKECDVGDICKGGCRSSNYFMTNSLFSNALCRHNV